MPDGTAATRIATPLPDRVLSPAELRALSARSDQPALRQLGIHLGILLVTGLMVAFAPGIWLLPAMFLFGLAQVTLFAPAHECMHRTAFASPRLNAIVGWLAAAPSLLNLDFYRAFHLAHHRHTQHPEKDPELDAIAPDDIPGYLIRVSGLTYWELRLRVIRDAWMDDMSEYEFISAEQSGRIINSVRLMSALMVGGALLSAYLFGWRTPLIFWIIPQIIAQPVLRAYLLAEHTGCKHEANGLINTRTTLTNKVVRTLMWNMPFHAEHHLYPSIPFHRLPDAHERIGHKLGVVQKGYARWNLTHVRGLLGV